MNGSRWSFDIGRVAGVRIRVHASFFLLLLFVLLAGGARTAAGALAEMTWILVIFACVTVHELAHSVVATHLGVKVRDIVLMPLGGVSEMERMPNNPRTEAAISGAGPGASLVLAGLFLAACVVVGQSAWPPTLIGGSVLARLGWLNALLAGFNLLPVLPMDGGRLLRAALEPRLGTWRSTIVAGQIGRIGAAVFIVVGFIYNWWLALIGLFILLGASAESADAAAHQKLSALTVQGSMNPWPWTAEADLYISPTALDEAVRRQGVLPITRDGRYLGVLGPGQRDRLSVPRPAGDVADRDALTVGPDEPLDHALDILRQNHQPAVVVVGPAGQILGIVTGGNLADALRPAS